MKFQIITFLWLMLVNSQFQSLDSLSSSFKTLGKRSIPDCLATKEDCTRFSSLSRVYKNCSNHGSCIKKQNPRKVKQECFYCQCDVKIFTDDQGNPMKNYNGHVDWTGMACESQDISISFHLCFWITIALLVAL